MGMIATGSHAFEVSDLPVKNNRAFHIDGGYAKLAHPIYQYPFLAFAETTLAVNLSGMAMRFLDLCSKLSHWEKAHERMNLVRRQFYETVQHSWEACIYHRPIPSELLNDITLTSRNLVSASRQVVNELYPCCGLKAANPDTRSE